VGDLTGPRVIYATDEFAYIVDLQQMLCIGKIPVEPDTKNRIDFGPLPETCVVGSYRGKLRAWNYRAGEVLWTSGVNRFSEIQHFGARPEIKVTKEGTVLLEFTTGRILETEQGWDMYLHPVRNLTIRFEEGRALIQGEARGRFKEIGFDSFAVLSHAWSEHQFACSSPEGHLYVFDLPSVRAPVCLKPDCWFNVRALAFSDQTGQLCGIAADWGGAPCLGLFTLQRPEKITLLAEVSNTESFCFLDRGRLAVMSDGALMSTKDGKLIKNLDWKRILATGNQNAKPPRD
jgi:hypothetical protein